MTEQCAARATHHPCKRPGHRIAECARDSAEQVEVHVLLLFLFLHLLLLLLRGRGGVAAATTAASAPPPPPPNLRKSSISLPWHILANSAGKKDSMDPPAALIKVVRFSSEMSSSESLRIMAA